MKKSTYFSNRFASALRGFRSNRKANQLSVVASAPAASEFEALEARILLSGIGTGLNRKNATFFDADGDKVTVTSLGKGAKFNIDLGGSTNNADIANIQIGAAGTSIGVVVTPVGSFTAPVQTKAFINPNWNLGDLGGNGGLSLDNLNQVNQKVQTQYYNLTPGYTNIGSITAAAGITTVGSIGLTAAVVPVIDLPGVAVGNINLSTGMVSKVDSFMATNGSYLQGYGGWTPGLANINLYDIDAGSIAGINISGIDPNNYNGPANFNGNDFLGTITTNAGGIGRLSGSNSQFAGQISLGGTDAFLGNVSLGRGWAAGSTISATGDLTFTAKNFDGVVDVAGHLNLGVQGIISGDFFAGEGISGLRAGDLDSVIIGGGAFTGSLVAKGGDIAGVTVAGTGSLGASLIESSAKIGTIWSNSSIDNALIIAGTDLAGITLRGATLGATAQVFVGGTLGSVDIAGGDLDAALAATDVSNVLVRGGNITGTLLASNGIGDVTIVDGQLTGSIIAQGAAGIGEIDITNLQKAPAIGTGALIYSAANIDGISAVTTGDTAIGKASIQALGTIGSFDVIAYGAGGTGGAIDGLTLILPSIGDISATSILGTAIANATFVSTSGNVGNISGTGLTGGIIDTSIISAGNVGVVTGTAIQTGPGIGGLTITAQTGINNIIGSSLSGDGIGAGTLVATNNFTTITGNVGSITGSSTSPAAAGNGISVLTVNAVAGSIGSIKGSAAGSGNGINSLTLQAATGIAAGAGESISGSSLTGNGIGGFSAFTTLAGNIGNITGSSTSATSANDGINGLAVTAIAGDVGNITGTAAGSGDGLGSLNVQADSDVGTISGSSFSGLGISAGTYKVTSGDIEAVNGSTSQGTAIGGGATFTSIGGQIKAISATPTGATGEAVNDARFSAASIGNLNFAVINLEGGLAVNKLQVTATNGNVGTITITNASLDATATGLTNSKIQATGDIGQITVSVVGSGADAISNLALTADSEGNDVGNITGVIVTSKQGDAITGTYGSDFNTFQGANVGPITATVTAPNGGNAIANLTVNSTVGTIGVIQATTASKTPLGAGIVSSIFDAETDIVSITATAISGSALADAAGNATTITSGNDIGAILLTSTTGSALSFATSKASLISVGNDLASFTAQTTGAGATVPTVVAVIKTDTALEVAGDVTGNILITNAGTAAGADAMNNVKLNITGSVIGTTTVTSVGGAAMNNATIDPVNMGAITLSGKVNAMTGSDIIATGAVASLTVNGTIDAGSTIQVGSITGATAVNAGTGGTGGNLDGAITALNGNINAVTIAGDLTGTLSTDDSGLDTGGSIGNVTVGGVFSGTISDTADTAANATIGDILIAKGATGGNITAEGALAKYTVSAGGSAATINVASITGTTNVTGDLTGNITSKLGSIGTITVLADLANAQPGDLSGAVLSATSIGNLSVAGDLSGSVTTQNGGIGTVAANELSGSLSATGTIAVDGTINAVTIADGSTAGINNITSTGALTSLTVSSKGYAGDVSVGNISGVTQVTGDLSGNITSTVGSIGTITVLADLLNTQAGDLTGAISAATSIGTVSVAGDLDGSVTSNNGGIGAITVTGELNGPISATGAVLTDGDIAAVTIGNGITATGSIFATDVLTSLTVSANGIAPGGFVTVGSISGVTNITGDLAGKITSTVGSIGNITVLADLPNTQAGNLSSAVLSATSVGNLSVAGDLSGLVTTLNGGIGEITVTGKLTGPISATGAVLTDGDIGAVTIGNGITATGTIFATDELTSLTVSANGIAAGGLVTVGSISGVTNITGDLAGNITSTVGSIGTITVLADLLNTQAGNLSGAVLSATSVGNLSVAGDLSGSVTTQNGGIGTVTVNELSGRLSATGTNAVDGTINAVTIADGSTAGLANITATGALTSLTVSAKGYAGDVSVGNIGATQVTGDLTGKITATDGIIGNVTVTGNIVNSTLMAVTSIGTVTANGTGNQIVNLDAPTVVAVTFKSMASGTTATISVGATATSLGAVTVGDPTAPAGLTITGGSASLVTVGNITVDGNANISGVTLGADAAVGDISVGGEFTTVGALSTAKTIGAFTVDSLAVPGAVNSIGAGTVGGSIGLITIGNDLANVGANKYNFTFDAYNGAPDDVIISSPAPDQLLNASAAPGTTSTLGGLTFIEV